MRALEAKVADVVWRTVESLLPVPVDVIRWVVTGPASLTGCASGGSSSGW
jgi:hypothetical protein